MNNNNQNRNNNRFDNNKDKNKGYDIDKGLDCIYPLLDRQNSVTSISDAVSEIEKLMIYACSDIEFTTHQMRNIYSIIKQNSDTLADLVINRPRLAYVGVRQKTRRGKDVVKLIDKLIIKIQNEPEEKHSTYIKGLTYVVESMVAYHKFHSKEQ